MITVQRHAAGMKAPNGRVILEGFTVLGGDVTLRRVGTRAYRMSVDGDEFVIMFESDRDIFGTIEREPVPIVGPPAA